MPAAGYLNDTNLNNAGSNGNYWSSSLNTDNSNNARNLNFNSDNVNTNNNRYNGQSVRPVSEFTEQASLPFTISRQQLLSDLYAAYKAARRHKRKKNYQLSFERNLENELVRLRDSIYNRTYRPGVSTCFIIHDPKMREVFAASFRDRVVHHLLCNYISPILEKGFIADSYSCIKGRGIHYGVRRLQQHISCVSHNFSRSCYVLKMDISGYFMHINRKLLLDLCRKALSGSAAECDMNLVDWLLETVVLQNPTDNCVRLGDLSEWYELPDSKSLFRSPEGCGLPIGNLTSQLFSNVYMNELDKFVTKELGFTHYGRYVDDFYIVANTKAELRKAIPIITAFLEERLHLSVNVKKTQIFSAYRGVEFLGHYLKPYRKYISNRTLERMERKIVRLNVSSSPKTVWRSLNSYLGLTANTSSYHVRTERFFAAIPSAFDYGYFTKSALTYRIY